MPGFFEILPLNRQSNMKAALQVANLVGAGMAFSNWLSNPDANWFESWQTMILHLSSAASLRSGVDSIEGFGRGLVNVFFLGAAMAGATTNATIASSVMEQATRMLTMSANVVEGFFGDHHSTNELRK